MLCPGRICLRLSGIHHSSLAKGRRNPAWPPTLKIARFSVSPPTRRNECEPRLAVSSLPPGASFRKVHRDDAHLDESMRVLAVESAVVHRAGDVGDSVTVGLKFQNPGGSGSARSEKCLIRGSHGSPVPDQ